LKKFTIHSDNRIEVAVSGVRVASPRGAATFATERDLAALALPMSRLVEIWNRLPGVKPVARFTDRKTAVRRIWGAIQGMTPPVTRGGHKARSDAPRAITKGAVVIAHMRAASGASLKAIMALTGWQAHTVRGCISAHLSKRLGLRVHSFKRDGERIYQIRG
jgi:hypothetical protein